MPKITDPDVIDGYRREWAELQETGGAERFEERAKCTTSIPRHVDLDECAGPAALTLAPVGQRPEPLQLGLLTADANALVQYVSPDASTAAWDRVLVPVRGEMRHGLSSSLFSAITYHSSYADHAGTRSLRLTKCGDLAELKPFIDLVPKCSIYGTGKGMWRASRAFVKQSEALPSTRIDCPRKVVYQSRPDGVCEATCSPGVAAFARGLQLTLSKMVATATESKPRDVISYDLFVAVYVNQRELHGYYHIVDAAGANGRHLAVQELASYKRIDEERTFKNYYQPKYEEFIPAPETLRPPPPFDTASVGPVLSQSSARLCADLAKHYVRVEFQTFSCTLAPLERRPSLDRWRENKIIARECVHKNAFRWSKDAEWSRPDEFEEDAESPIDLQTELEQIMEQLWHSSVGEHRFMASILSCRGQSPPLSSHSPPSPLPTFSPPHASTTHLIPLHPHSRRRCRCGQASGPTLPAERVISRRGGGGAYIRHVRKHVLLFWRIEVRPYLTVPVIIFCSPAWDRVG